MFAAVENFIFLSVGESALSGCGGDLGVKMSAWGHWVGDVGTGTLA